MSDKRLKAKDRITGKMTQDGLVERNEATGEETRVSRREQDIDLSGQTGDTPDAIPRSRHQQPTSDTNGRDAAPTETQSGPQTTQQCGAGALGRASRLRYADTEPAPVDVKPERQNRPQPQPDSRREDAPAPETPMPVTPTSDTPDDHPVSADTTGGERQSPGDAPKLHNKQSRLQFSEDEAAPPGRKLKKAQRQSDRASVKLERARDNLPAKRRLRTTVVRDEKTGKVRRKLYFEKQVKSQAEHMKGPLPLRPVKAGGNAALAFGHRKMYQVEDENVGTKAAHRGAMVAEAGVRSALRYRKTAPYRKAARLEHKATQKSTKLAYRKTLAENPKLKSSVLSRLWQKRKIKKQYAKTARETQKAAKRAKKAASTVESAIGKTIMFIARHPFAFVIILLLTLIIVLLLSMCSAGGGAGTGGLGGVLAGCYLAEDADVDNAELNYTDWETDLQIQLDDAESSHSGFDEYRYDVGEIGHDPYELMAYLTAVYQDFTYDAIADDLRALFDGQYQLTFTESVERKTRPVTGTDPETGEETIEQEEYDWHVLTVTLTAYSFTDMISGRMDSEQQEIFNVLMQTKGSRQYINNPLDFNWLPHVKSNYGWRVHPITGAKDYHKGVDISLPVGTEIFAGHDGTASTAYDAGGYGNYVTLTGKNGLVSNYAHLSSVLVSDGQTVTMGDLIALSGNSGSSTGPHLHLEIIKNGQYLNPLYFAVTGDVGFNMPHYGGYGSAMGDGSYAALIAEAERHLGKPYKFGANGPDKFDCSSYICWILRESGVWNIGRTTAQDLYNRCDPVPVSEAKPGDLVFFQGTYSTSNTVTHVGLYVGNNTFIHCGKPVQYATIEGFWQTHFYSFARIPT